MQPIFSSIIINLIKQPVCNEAYRLLAFYNSNESSASTHICKLPSRYNLAYSSGSSTASEVNAQSDPGVVFKSFFRLPSSQCEAYSQHLYKCQCCFVVDCILQILFSSYPISLSFNQSLVVKLIDMLLVLFGLA